MGPFGSPQTQPCSWQLLALAQPPASWSVNFPSPRFVRRTFFRSCGCLLGPVAGIGIGAGAGTGTSDKGPDKTGHGPEKVPSDPLQAPTKKIQPASTAVLFTVFTAG